MNTPEDHRLRDDLGKFPGNTAGPPIEPSGDELRLVISQGPVSLQSTRAKKDALREVLRSALGVPKYLLTGEVSVVLEWMIHERTRYETLLAPDVDNTLKVVLDTLCGPAGVLVNDCQVQHVSCHWIDWSRSDQQLTVTIKHLPDEWVRKDGLVFVRLVGRLCWPLNIDPPYMAEPILDALEKMVATYQELLHHGVDWNAARYVLPAQQPFHSGRLRGFNVLAPDEIRRQLSAKGRGDRDEGA